MDNEVLRQLYERKSVRVFTDQPIGETDVQAMSRSLAEYLKQYE